MRSEDDYCDLVGELSERLSTPDPDEHIRQIARQEADNRVMVFIGIGAFFWASREFGWIGGVSVLGLGICVAMFSAWSDARNPRHERHLVTLNAENLVRLEIIAEVAAAGKKAWKLKEKEYERDKRQIVAAENDHWDRFWERTYRTALEFEKLSPKERAKRILNAANAAKESLAHANDMAKRDKAELIFWAANALHLVEQA